jgi:hypothetical protein
MFGVEAKGPAQVPLLRSPRSTVRVPAITIHAQYGVRLRLPRVPRLMAVPRPPGPGFRAYVLPLSRTLLTIASLSAFPQGADVGADGSFGLSLARPPMTLTLASDSVCYGCSLGGAAFWFPALARAYQKQYGIREAHTIAQLKGLVAYRYWRPRLAVYAFFTVHGQVHMGFVAAPMSVRTVGAYFYSASWTGPLASMREGDYELAAAYRALSQPAGS